MHRAALLVVFPVFAVLVPGSAYSQTVEEVPAPTATAEGTAVRVELGDQEVIAIGETSATAGTTAAGSEARAAAIELGGEPPAAQLGGTQTGPGESEGAILDTAGTLFDELGRVAVAAWRASVSEDAAGRHSHARASLVEVRIAPGGNKVLDVTVLNSESAADHSNALSTGRSSTDGVILVLGDPAAGQGLEIRILHSEASSAAGSSTYLVSVNGTEIGGSNDDLGQGLAQACAAVNIPGLLRLFCVQASGGMASFLHSVLGDGAARGGDGELFAAATSGGAAPVTAAGAPSPGGPAGAAGGAAGAGDDQPPAAVFGATVSGPPAAGAADTAPAAGDAPGADGLPATGGSLTPLVSGMALIVAGMAARLRLAQWEFET